MLVEELGHPIISTSVTNRKGEIYFDPEEIQRFFNPHVDIMLSTGALSGQPSTIIDLSGEEPEIIREGAGDISFLF